MGVFDINHQSELKGTSESLSLFTIKLVNVDCLWKGNRVCIGSSKLSTTSGIPSVSHPTFHPPLPRPSVLDYVRPAPIERLWCSGSGPLHCRNVFTSGTTLHRLPSIDVGLSVLCLWWLALVFETDPFSQ